MATARGIQFSDYLALIAHVGKALSILRQKSREHTHFAIDTQISTAMWPAAKAPHTLVHTDLAKFGAHAHLDKDRAVTDAGGGQALDLRCRTFNLLPPDYSRLRVPVCRSMVHPHCRPRLRITPSQKSRSSILWPGQLRERPCIAQLDGYLRHRNAQTVGRDLTERRIGARAHVLRAALDQQRPIGFQANAQLAG
jgi:hypothetical protein